MASVIIQEFFYSNKNLTGLLSPFTVAVRNSSRAPLKKPKRGTIKHRNLIESSCQSLADRGFLRSQKPYAPPPEAKKKVLEIIHGVLGADFDLKDPIPKTNKFELLNRCFEEFDHSISNSMLHKMTTAKDVLDFYLTPVITKSPYDNLKEMNLPPNLHVIEDYTRFDLENDMKFDGITAFPESPTVVTGLKYRKKYKGSSKPLPQHYFNEAVFLPKKKIIN